VRPVQRRALRRRAAVGISIVANKAETTIMRYARRICQRFTMIFIQINERTNGWLQTETRTTPTLYVRDCHLDVVGTGRFAEVISAVADGIDRNDVGIRRIAQTERRAVVRDRSADAGHIRL